jgi:hypothetical protein
MMEVLKPTAYSCTNHEHVVVLTVGGKKLKMDHHTAFRMAAFLHHSATQAKTYTGDMGHTIIGIGTLTDAVAEELKAQKRRDATAALVR